VRGGTLNNMENPIDAIPNQSPFSRIDNHSIIKNHI
jgi:hypothetical protein